MRDIAAGARRSSTEPLALLEVGASAGLCLYPDRYAYRYGDGPVLGTGAPLLECAITGPVPVPDRAAGRSSGGPGST